MERIYRTAVTKLYMLTVLGALVFTGFFFLLIVAPFMWDMGMTTIAIVTIIFYLILFWILKRKQVDPRIRKMKRHMQDNSTPM